MRRITKIDWTDFIPYSKYLELEEKYNLILRLYNDESKTNENLVKNIFDLEEENKKLKEDVDFFYKSAKQFREENKNLQEELSKLKEKYWDIDY